MPDMAKQIDLAKHVLVPSFTKLSEDEVNALLARFNISKAQLPVILEKDPVAKLAEAVEGDVLRFTRQTKTGEAPYFRVVVS